MPPSSPSKPGPAPENRPVLSVAALERSGARPVALVPGPDVLAQLRRALGLSGLRKVALRGTLAPLGRHDWQLTATLGATMVQPCVVSLAPVTTRIDEKVERIWRAEMWQPDQPDSEIEMPEDVREEPLGREIDLGAVLAEALALAVPAYPRAEGARLQEAVFTEPGAVPMRDEDARPFAALAGLKGRLRDAGGDEGDEGDDGNEGNGGDGNR